jgi:glycosyltransferase involved in cell wall biosynthesis
VASDETKTDLRRKYGIDEHAFVVLHVGHINPNRNIELLKSVAGIGDIKVVMVGSTSTPQNQDMMQNMRRSGVMVMTEYIPHIEEIYQLADAYLFPVVSDNAAIGVPLSVLEAMSCNLPIITTRFGGLPIMFREDAGFFYFDQADELTKLIEATSGLKKCTTREMVATYDWKTIAQAILKEEII